MQSPHTTTELALLARDAETYDLCAGGRDGALFALGLAIPYHRYRPHWYDFVLFPLALVIVYPDRILEWVSARRGKVCGWGCRIGLELVAVSLMVGGTFFLKGAYPKMDWFPPVLLVAFLVA